MIENQVYVKCVYLTEHLKIIQTLQIKPTHKQHHPISCTGTWSDNSKDSTIFYFPTSLLKYELQSAKQNV